MKDDGIIITTYAPVAIVTLWRFEHLKRLLDSLERNPLAEFTEVYISVDFPPNEKYIAGHDRIISYLKSRSFRFKKTNLFFQNSNLGPTKNGYFLLDIVYETYDRAIILEDDNEVAQNFLEYMDKALEYGKDKEDILYVCAFSGYDSGLSQKDKGKGTAFMAQFVTWGSGIWKDKERYITESISNEWIDDITHDWKKLYMLYKRDRGEFMIFCRDFVFDKNSNFYVNGKVVPMDETRTVSMIFNDKYAILPIESKIRNYGYDGTGVNCGGTGTGVEETKIGQPLDINDRYNFVMESDTAVCKKIQRHFSNKRGLAFSKIDSIKTLLYCFYFIHIKNKRLHRDCNGGSISG